MNLQKICLIAFVILLSGCKWQLEKHTDSWRSAESVAYTMLTENDAPWLGLRALHGRVLKGDIERHRFVKLESDLKNSITQNLQENLQRTFFGSGILIASPSAFILTKDNPQLLIGLWNGKKYEFWLAGKETSADEVLYFCEYQMFNRNDNLIEHTGGSCYSNKNFEKIYEVLLAKYWESPDQVYLNIRLLGKIEK